MLISKFLITYVCILSNICPKVHQRRVYIREKAQESHQFHHFAPRNRSHDHGSHDGRLCDHLQTNNGLASLELILTEFSDILLYWLGADYGASEAVALALESVSGCIEEVHKKELDLSSTRNIRNKAEEKEEEKEEEENMLKSS